MEFRALLDDINSEYGDLFYHTEKKKDLLRTSGKRTKEETSEVLCVECGIVWGKNMDITKRIEEKRIEAFEMWMWRRTVRVKRTDRIRNKIVFEKTTLGYVDHMRRLRGRQKIGKIEIAGFAMKDLPMDRTLIYVEPPLIKFVVLNKVGLLRPANRLRLRWAGHVARMGESGNACRVLVGRPEGKRRMWSPKRGWEDNIKIYLSEVGYDSGDWINLAQDRERLWAYEFRQDGPPVSVGFKVLIQEGLGTLGRWGYQAARLRLEPIRR
ncbi:hypothetical protein ANN_00733 [Periplaneta americana]|uniref:Uncharacterized protein n=1 Tax=Periplaneta americana TaxID=6978 RepID=A0ABQ8TRN9_PERAM|nr:hypothetical protein ANN_00733 [Periplaneta americana]